MPGDLDDIIALGGLITFVVCFLLSVVVALRKAQPLDRLLPLALQGVLAWLTLNSYNHGFPAELFFLFVLYLFWSLPVFFSAWRLSRLTALYRVMSWLQLLEALMIVWLSFFAYAQSCFRHYGHLVWNP